MLLPNQPGWPDWANFRPMGDWLLTLGSGLKITELAQMSGLLLPWYQLCIIFFYKKWLWLNSGDFLTNLSGHPVPNLHSTESLKSRYLFYVGTYIWLRKPFWIKKWRFPWKKSWFFVAKSVSKLHFFLPKSVKLRQPFVQGIRK
jgi:hypothetical protein